MKLADLIDSFLNQYIDSTRNSYTHVLTDMRDYIGQSRPVDEIHAIDLINYTNNLRKRAGIKSPHTYNKYVKTMRVFFNWLVKMELLTSSPAAAIKYMPANKRVKENKAMPYDAYLQLLDFAKWDPRKYALVLFFGDTGCRRGGATGLQWHHINYDAREATVTEKGKPPRIVDYGDECARALMAWQMRQRPTMGQYVFSANGQKVTSAALGQYFRRMCYSAGIGSYGPHAIRHMVGFQSQQTNDVATSAGILGHTNKKTTWDSYYRDDRDYIKSRAATRHYRPDNDDNILHFPTAIGD